MICYPGWTWPSRSARAPRPPWDFSGTGTQRPGSFRTSRTAGTGRSPRNTGEEQEALSALKRFIFHSWDGCQKNNCVLIIALKTNCFWRCNNPSLYKLDDNKSNIKHLKWKHWYIYILILFEYMEEPISKIKNVWVHINVFIVVNGHMISSHSPWMYLNSFQADLVLVYHSLNY